MNKTFTRYQKRIVKKLRPLLRFLDDMNQKNLGVIAAGIAYYTLLAVFPAMGASVAITLFVLEPSQIQTIMTGLEAYIPKEITDMLSVILSRQADSDGNLVVAALGIGLALFGASGAMDNMTKALNAVYSKKETRNIVRLKLLSIILTIGTIILAGTVAILLLLSYNQLVFWRVPEWWALMLSLLRWPLMIVLINGAILLLFRYGANRERTAWRFTTPGVATTTALWLLVTVGFVAYMQNSANLSQAYSVFAGIIALMMWFNLTATAVLVGALVDARRAR